MADHKLKINDETSTADGIGAGSNEDNRESYTVAKGHTLFKNGKTYKAGQKVKLDEKTAKNFAAAGDIERKA